MWRYGVADFNGLAALPAAKREIEMLVKRGSLDAGDRENLGSIQEAANDFISNALVTS